MVSSFSTNSTYLITTKFVEIESILVRPVYPDII